MDRAAAGRPARAGSPHHDLHAAIGLVASGVAPRVVLANLDEPLLALGEVRSEALQAGVVVEALFPMSPHTPLLVRRAPRIIR